MVPGLLDRYLARTGYKAQQTDRPRDPDQPANLWEPADDDVDYGAHGDFDTGAHANAPQVWASQHHALLLGAAGALAAGAVAARLLRR